MALWQCRFEAVQEASLHAHYGCIPVVIPIDDRDRVIAWTGADYLNNAENAFDKRFNRRSSWSPAITAWGQEDGDDIQILRLGDGKGEVLFRVDARFINLNFLSKLVESLSELRCYCLTEDNRVGVASVSLILSAIRRSPCAKFVADPEAFLKGTLPESE